MAGRAEWPELSEARDRPTIVSLHLFSQIAGKAAVALLPWRNHGWHLTLRVHPRGFRTAALFGAGRPLAPALGPPRGPPAPRRPPRGFAARAALRCRRPVRARLRPHRRPLHFVGRRGRTRDG